MNSEKVKEIKKCLENCINDCGALSCPYNTYEKGLKCIEDLQKDCLMLINELESENEMLENKNYQLEQDLGQCENGYKLELHTARYQLHSANEDLQKAKDRIAELEKHIERVESERIRIKQDRDKKDELASKFIDSYNDSLKQFAERLIEKCEYNKKQYCCEATVSANDIDETLKEFIK